MIGSSWRSIVNSCVTELEEIDSGELITYREFAQESAQALLGGFPGSSQALSANVLDTLIRRYVDHVFRNSITGRNKTTLDAGLYSLREYFVWAGLSGAHIFYDSRSGDPVPRGFTRHGTAHGVSSRQYNRINAVIALMHVVALLRLLNSQPHETLGANTGRPHPIRARNRIPAQ